MAAWQDPVKSIVEQKTPGQTLIAHISDLHFTSQIQESKGEWQALENDVRLFPIDLLIVTRGPDRTTNAFSSAKAHRAVRQRD